MENYDVDALVIGAGAIGLAVARALAIAGRDVVIVEAEGAIGTHTSSRNSEVVHAGMYYPHGSLKARTCVEGNRRLRKYLDARGVYLNCCGKLIVATTEEETKSLVQISRAGQANGVDDLEMLSAEAAKRMEPELFCTEALYSPSTAIFDSHGYMMSLLADAQDHGAVLAVASPVTGGHIDARGICVRAGTPEAEFRCRTVVNCASLSATTILRQLDGFPPQQIPIQYYAKGNYFVLAGRTPFSRLIYPVPEAAGLGTHLTLDAQGRARFGPDVEWVSTPTNLDVDPARCEGFYAAIRRYWPGLQDGTLSPGYAGIRPKLQPAGAPQSDFMIQGPQTHGVPGLINLFGIESPGLTASLPLADLVLAMVQE